MEFPYSGGVVVIDTMGSKQIFTAQLSRSVGDQLDVGTTTATHEKYRYWDDAVVSDRRIGCGP